MSYDDGNCKFRSLDKLFLNSRQPGGKKEFYGIIETLVITTAEMIVALITRRSSWLIAEEITA